ncbi:hypothetical protein FGG08_000978 [Glutinoglossum americanum]|uniref:Uncharacterized protein n=1 Tax=Glutinoglossum americanum TaxID=1670608 RepID=A0A9P8IHH8_9PEZI|nr:hypothetical protein FGG08_000978 [Glutinoglossum americanum]
MLRLFVKTTKSLFFPALNIPQQNQELAAPPLPAEGNPTSSIRYSVGMVQTRRQSRSFDGEGIKGNANAGTTEQIPTTLKRSTGGNGSPISVSRKRRKVIPVERSVGSPEDVSDPEMEGSITLLPDLPVRSKGNGEVAEREAREFMTSGTLEPEETKTRSNEPPKPTHTRFASEEPEPRMATTIDTPRGNSAKPVVEDSEDDESEDDAPEAVTLLSGQDQARSREEEATKALEKQEVDARKKRKERDARLKEQAASSRRNKKRKFRELEEDEASIVVRGGPVLTKPGDRSFTKSGLPALLPDEVLLAEPALRPPTPPLERNGRKQSQLVGKHKIFRERPPRDVRRGPVRVRVLESANEFLPPKVRKASSSIKQRWLAGRPGRNGHPQIERRKVGGGFLRR